jgi:hypothetical protein
MSVTSVQRTDRTAKRNARSVAVSFGPRGSSSRRARLERSSKGIRCVAHRRDALPGVTHGARGLRTESSR